jgi:hypothetical protein
VTEQIRERLGKGMEWKRNCPGFGINKATLRKGLKAGIIPTSLRRFKPAFTEEMGIKQLNIS